MSKRANGSSILTANRLSDGRAVFLDFEGAWGESIDVALVARTTGEVAELEARGAFDAAQNLVVEPYLVEVREAEGRLLPVRQRERVRAGGPSILDDVPGYVAPGAMLRQAQHKGAAAGGELRLRAAEPAEAA
jgi:hypothetical protein